jgi:hypothetical protein
LSVYDAIVVQSENYAKVKTLISKYLGNTPLHPRLLNFRLLRRLREESQARCLNYVTITAEGGCATLQQEGGREGSPLPTTGGWGLVVVFTSDKKIFKKNGNFWEIC